LKSKKSERKKTTKEIVERALEKTIIFSSKGKIAFFDKELKKLVALAGEERIFTKDKTLAGVPVEMLDVIKESEPVIIRKSDLNTMCRNAGIDRSLIYLKKVNYGGYRIYIARIQKQ